MAMQRNLTEIELAARWNVSRRTLQRWRSLRRGPAFSRIGRISYAIDDVLAYERAARTDVSCLSSSQEAET